MHHLPEIHMYNVIIKINKKNRTLQLLQAYTIPDIIDVGKKSNIPGIVMMT